MVQLVYQVYHVCIAGERGSLYNTTRLMFLLSVLETSDSNWNINAIMHITHTPHYRNHITHHTTPHHINHTPYRSIGVFEMVNHMIEPLPFLIPTRYIFNIYDIIIKIEPRIDQDHLPSLQSHEMRGRN